MDRDRETFRIVPADGRWAFDHDGERSIVYATREAAFEAVLGAVSNAIKKGAAISIVIEAPPPGEAVTESRRIP